MSFDDATALVLARGGCAFAAVPVFGDDGETAEGARVFIVQGAEPGGVRVRFIAGPFFSKALAADEIYSAGDIPQRVRELRFLPSTLQEEWCTDQIQVLIGHLMRASQAQAPEMPDYLSAPRIAAAPEVVFPVSMIGRAGAKDRPA